MGLIRKTLSVGTVGVVKGSSKKQRTAKATLMELQRQNAILDGSAAAEAAQAAARQHAKQQRKAMDNLLKQQQRIAGNASAANAARLSEAEARVRSLGLSVPTAPVYARGQDPRPVWERPDR